MSRLMVTGAGCEQGYGASEVEIGTELHFLDSVDRCFTQWWWFAHSSALHLESEASQEQQQQQ
jgi:hypothetical protein